ncbi:NUDIX hydrolase [Ornithinimicrobium murale]|uniref:NUDIX hydrolase n=1 Tax=Ornithinimicrobium murale TaxID=1050153 RepID=UPI000E0DF9DE|nr:NUDIX domain-containing protein [Ornithinimicrobium murale]
MAGEDERLHAYLDGELPVPTPREAATVVLLRDGSAAIEVLLLERPRSMKFVPGAHVFPGGSVSPRDAGFTWAADHPDALRLADDLDCPVPEASALASAAVRETFEEAGVLLASAGGRDLTSADLRAWQPSREELVTDALGLPDFLRREGLELRLDWLRPLSRWITPAWSPIRFDTRFFAARLPAKQEVVVRAAEVAGHRWVTAAAGFAAFHAGALHLRTPTAAILRELRGYASVEQFLERPTGPLDCIQIDARRTADAGIELGYEDDGGFHLRSSLIAGP